MPCGQPKPNAFSHCSVEHALSESMSASTPTDIRATRPERPRPTSPPLRRPPAPTVVHPGLPRSCEDYWPLPAPARRGSGAPHPRRPTARPAITAAEPADCGGDGSPARRTRPPSGRTARGSGVGPIRPTRRPACVGWLGRRTWARRRESGAVPTVRLPRVDRGGVGAEDCGVGSGYLDAAAGVPLHPAAAEALLAALDDGWADPARLYGAGRRARLLLDARPRGDRRGARRPPGRAHLRAVRDPGRSRGRARRRWPAAAGPAPGSCTRAVEHSCVLHAAERHVAAGGEATSVPVDRDGRVDVAAFAAAADGAALASLQTANHEVGTLQPVAEVAAACREPACRCTSTPPSRSAGSRSRPAGRCCRPARTSGAARPGSGVLAVRTGTRWRSPLPADERERGRVPGFENVPAAVAAAAALRAVRAEAAAENARLSALVDRIRAAVAARVPDVEVVGDRPTDRLPHLVTFSCLYVDGEALLHELDRHGFAVSQRLVVHLVDADARRTCWRRWVCSRTATCGSRCTATRPRPTSTASWPCCPGSSPTSGTGLEGL